jgi:hypothetical protein
MDMRPVVTRQLFGTLLFSASVLVLGGCGNASAWTTLHARHLPGGKQYVLQGSRDANGFCVYNLAWLPSGTMEQDVARDDSTCHLVAEVAPTVPNRRDTAPIYSRTRRVP